MSAPFFIDPASPRDRETLVVLYHALLADVARWGHDTPATRANAEWFVDRIFMPAAAVGDGVLIARDLKGRPIGAIFWCRAFPMPGAELSAFGYGTYVLPGAQRRGVGAALREAAMAKLRTSGVKRVVGAALAGNAAGHASLRKLGFEPTTTLYERRLG